MSTRLLGIIGGMGPLATAAFMRRLTELTYAEHDQDHLRSIVINATETPDRTSSLLREGAAPGIEAAASPLPVLKNAALRLKGAGCELLAMPCNTAHRYLDAIVAACGIPVVPMIDETAAACREAGFARIVVLATDGTVGADLYGKACGQAGVESVYPPRSMQDRITELIEAIKRGQYSTAVMFRLLSDAAVWGGGVGADAVILACTELSAAFHDIARTTDRLSATYDGFSLPVVDAMDVLALRVIEEAGASTRMQHRKDALCAAS